MDIVYILGDKTQNDNMELRLSLRSIEKYANCFDNVVIVGRKPDWLVNVEWISVADIYTAEKNAFNKTLVACQNVNESLFFMNDDFFMMKEFSCQDYPYYVLGDLVYINNPSRYQMIQNKSMRELERLGKGIKDFRVHCPIRYDVKKYLELKKYFDESMQSDVGYSPRILYGNLFCDDVIKVADCKLWANEGVRDSETGCISTTDDAHEVYNFLMDKFRQKSRFER